MIYRVGLARETQSTGLTPVAGPKLTQVSPVSDTRSLQHVRHGG